MGENLADFTSLGASVVAISTDPLEDAIEMAVQNSIPFPVLADADGSVARKWGVFDLLDDDLAAPATFIINRDGSIAWQRISTDANSRPGADETLFALAASQDPM